jgi:hypothetical protein
MKKKVCIECGEALQGRVDKVFCSDSCRSTYHNRINAGATAFIRRINRILRENRRILADLNPDGKARVARQRLLERGFKFSYFTNEYATRNGNLYRFCYDYGYKVSEGDYLTIVIRQEYVD